MREFLTTVPSEESSYPQPHLHCINPRIRRGQSRIRNVQVPQLQTPVVFRAEDVRPQCRRRSEVHGIGAKRNVVVGEQRAAAEFEVGRKRAAAHEIPLEAKWVKSHAVSSVGGLEDEKHGDRIHGVLESSTKKAGKMRAGDDPSVAQAGVEDAGVAASAAHGMAAARPYLDFVAVFFGASLRQANGGYGQR